MFKRPHLWKVINSGRVWSGREAISLISGEIDLDFIKAESGKASIRPWKGFSGFLPSSRR